MNPGSTPLVSSNRPSSRRRVLLMTASVGAGHNQAAQALQAALSQADANLDVTVLDALDFTPRFFRLKYARGYALCVSRLPRLYGLGYALTDRPRGGKRTIWERRRLGSERRALWRLSEEVLRRDPDLIVHTHFLAPPYLHRLGRRFRQVIVTTDLLPHRWWYCEEIERYFTAFDLGRARLAELGVPAERITVSGMPIHPKWTALLPDRAAILRQWSLPGDKKIVLLAGGADFTCGPVVEIARRLVLACPAACVVVLGGRNKKLLGRLAGLAEAAAGRVVPMGFTDRLHELASLADVMITKAGGLTTAECLAKRLPMVFLRPVPGQERQNAEFFTRAGAGQIAQNVSEAVDTVSSLLENDARRQRLAEAAGRLYQPGETVISQAIARSLASGVPV